MVYYLCSQCNGNSPQKLLLRDQTDVWSLVYVSVFSVYAHLFPPLTAPQPTMLEIRVFTTSRFLYPKRTEGKRREQKKRERD